MAGQTQTLTFKRVIQASPAEVYRAFTNSTALREWLSDAAQADARAGGRLYLWWSDGHYVSGEFKTLAAGEKVAFTWGGPREAGLTRVNVALKEKEGGTEVTLKHSGVGKGGRWSKTLRRVRAWEAALENLQSVLETGHDLRFTLRPMLGVQVGEWNAGEAAKLGVPVAEGLRLDGVVDGMGAQAAGLQKDDVIVSLGRRNTTGWPSLAHALAGRRAGDQVDVVFYRGAEQHTVPMKLSQRPLPDVPTQPADLAEAVRQKYADADAALEAFFEGVSEAEADYHPAPGEWNAKEVLAHLIAGERDNHSWLADIVGGHERWYDDWGGNVTARLVGTTAAYPTIRALLDELKRNEAETVAAVAALPEAFAARKGSYWRLGFNLLQLSTHADDHLAQMRANVEAARAANVEAAPAAAETPAPSEPVTSNVSTPPQEASMRNRTVIGVIILIAALIVGQGLAFLLNGSGYLKFLATLPVVLSQVAFWGPIIAVIASAFIIVTMRLLGFNTLEEIRIESVEQNNPTPAIVFVGTLIASILFLSLLIRP